MQKQRVRMNVSHFIGDVLPFVMSQFVYLIVRLFNFQACFQPPRVAVIDITVCHVVDTDNDDAKFKPLISMYKQRVVAYKTRM